MKHIMLRAIIHFFKKAEFVCRVDKKPAPLDREEVRKHKIV